MLAAPAGGLGAEAQEGAVDTLLPGPGRAAWGGKQRLGQLGGLGLGLPPCSSLSLWGAVYFHCYSICFLVHETLVASR